MCSWSYRSVMGFVVRSSFVYSCVRQNGCRDIAPRLSWRLAQPLQGFSERRQERGKREREPINALICMPCTALRQLLWHRLVFAYICPRQAFVSLALRSQTSPPCGSYSSTSGVFHNKEVLGPPLPAGCGYFKNKQSILGYMDACAKSSCCFFK